MPIFEIVFSRPLLTASIARASSAVSPAALATSSRDRREHHVRVHCGCAVADQHRDALHAARLARLDDEPRLQARARAHEMVVDRRRPRAATASATRSGPDRAVGERRGC